MSSDEKGGSADAAVNWFDVDRMVFRVSDRSRFDYAVHAVSDEGKGLAVICRSEAALDHYGRLLFKQLREMDQVQVEVYFPTSTDWLLMRFNQILGGLSLKEATARATRLPPRILVINDAIAITPSEGQLLARLVNDFPGGNIRIVMMIHDRAGLDLTRVTAPFGKKMLPWVIEPPSISEARVLLDAGRVHGYEPEVLGLLRQLGMSVLPETDQTAYSTMEADQQESGPAQVQQTDVNPTEALSDTTVGARSGALRGALVVVLLTSTLVALAWGVRSGWLSGDGDFTQAGVNGSGEEENANHDPSIGAREHAGAETATLQSVVTSDGVPAHLEALPLRVVPLADLRQSSPSATGALLPLVGPFSPDVATAVELSPLDIPGGVERANPIVMPWSVLPRPDAFSFMLGEGARAPEVSSERVPFDAKDTQQLSASLGERGNSAEGEPSLMREGAGQTLAAAEDEGILGVGMQSSELDEPVVRDEPHLLMGDEGRTAGTGEGTLAQLLVVGEDALSVVLSAPDDSFFVQHIILGSVVGASQWVERNMSDYDAVLVAPVRFRNVTQYAVLSGPLESEADARALVRDGGLRDRWVRNVSALRNDLVP